VGLFDIESPQYLKATPRLAGITPLAYSGSEEANHKKKKKKKGRKKFFFTS
jgi:hypothetical protein